MDLSSKHFSNVLILLALCFFSCSNPKTNCKEKCDSEQTLEVTRPLTELPGENKDRAIASFNFTITTDRNGNFTGVKIGDKSFNLKEWNKQFQNTKPKK